MTDPNTNLSSPPNGVKSPGRRALVGGVAVTAALAGAGLAWWNTRDTPIRPDSVAMEGFWSSQWDAPDGKVWSMSAFKGRPLLLNFWATWCPPCVDELPLINAFFHQNQANGWQVLGLAVDKLASVQEFLKKLPLDFPVGMAGLAGTDLSRSLGNLAGGLPFTVVFGVDGSVLHRKMGRVHAEDLAAWVRLK